MEEIGRKILLNPGPGTTSEAVKRAMVVNDICPRESEFGDLMLEMCQDLVTLGNGGNEYEACLFAASGTGAVEAILTSAISDSDKALIVTNGAYGFRMADICASYQLSNETICSFGEYPQVDKIRQRLEVGDITHLAMIHHETSTGMMNPLEEISRACEDYGVALIVDAMSSFGAYPIDLTKIRISYLTASSNKCIQGMAGLSFVLFHKDHIDDIKGNKRSFYFDLYNQWSHLKNKKQMRFTPPVQVCYAFKQAIKETLRETVDARWKRYQENWQVLYDGLKGLGFDFFLPMEQQSKILMAIKLNEELPLGFNHFHDYLFQRDITVYPGVIPETTTFRVAVIGDLQKKDMEYVIQVMKEYAALEK